MDELIGMVKEYGRLCAEDLPESAERELEAIKAMLAALLPEAL